MANPLDAFANRPATFPRDFRIPPMPKLRESLQGKSLPDALEHHDESLEQWRQEVERSIATRLPQATTTTTTQAATTTAQVQAPSSPAAPLSAPVPGTTDDLPEGTVNLYMTSNGWVDLFKKFGFQTNHVLSTETLIVPEERNAVIAGPLLVEGNLIVNGYLALLPIP